MTAKKFISELSTIPVDPKADNSRFFHGDLKKNKFFNVRMASIFALAKKYAAMPLAEIGMLLESPYYEARMGAVSIMDFQARDKKITPQHQKALYDLYIRRHNRINNWDLVDRSAPYVVGGYLHDKPKTPLTKLAKSKDPLERRTAIVSTYYFIRQQNIDETFRIAKLLVHDPDDLVNKAVGSWIREAGKKDELTLLDFLDTHAATMPRVTLRYATEKLSKKQRDKYLKAGK